MKKEPEQDISPPILKSTTPEGRENELINMAYDLVAQRLANGTATSAETVHFLKMGSARERLEKRLIEKDLELKQAKTEALQSSKQMESLFAEVMTAMKSYSGAINGVGDDYGND